LNFKEILELIDKVAERGIGALEIEQAGTKLRIEGKSPAPAPQVIHAFATDHAPSAPQLPAIPLMPVPAASAAPALVAADDPSVHIITSPIVGTFYRSPNPESPPFVNVGDRISKGQVLCIIEAMKLMNEIESEVDGVVVRIFPQAGQPIEYGEQLFSVKI